MTYTYNELKELQENIDDLPIDKIKELLQVDETEWKQFQGTLDKDMEYLKWWYEDALRERFKDWLDECLYDGRMLFYGDEKYNSGYGDIIIKNVPYKTYGNDKCYGGWDSMRLSFIYEYMIENKINKFDFSEDWNNELENKLRQTITEYEEKSLLEKVRMTMKDIPLMNMDKNGRILIDFDNPEHVKIYEKWMKD